jgi:hypothetical protein
MRYMLLPSSKTTIYTPPAVKRPRRRLTEAKRPRHKNYIISGTSDYVKHSSQLIRPITTIPMAHHRGDRSWRLAKTSTRPATTWKPRADHLGRLAAPIKVLEKEGVLSGANPNGLDQEPFLHNTTPFLRHRKGLQLGKFEQEGPEPLPR